MFPSASEANEFNISQFVQQGIENGAVALLRALSLPYEATNAGGNVNALEQADRTNDSDDSDASIAPKEQAKPKNEIALDEETEPKNENVGPESTNEANGENVNALERADRTDDLDASMVSNEEAKPKNEGTSDEKTEPKNESVAPEPPNDANQFHSWAFPDAVQEAPNVSDQIHPWAFVRAGPSQYRDIDMSSVYFTCKSSSSDDDDHKHVTPKSKRGAFRRWFCSHMTIDRSEIDFLIK